MPTIAIIYHSQSGHTKKVAEWIHKGASSVANIQADLFTADQAIKAIESLTQYDGIIFGAPTFMGSIAAEFKKFMEASHTLWPKKLLANKLAGGFTNSCSLSGDKFNSLVQLVTFAAQHHMLWVPLNIPNQTARLSAQSGDPALLNRVGSSLGLAAQSEKDNAETTPPIGDLKTASAYGEHFANCLLRWSHEAPA